jgi:ribosomal protein L37AE/L43A
MAFGGGGGPAASYGGQYGGGQDYSSYYSQQSSANPRHADKKCNQCGQPGHIARDCQAPVCRRCGQAGHETSACPESQKAAAADDEDNDTIYINGLPTSITEEELERHFGSIGKVKMAAGKGKDRFTKKPKIWLYRDKTTGAPKGDATFTYEDAHSAPAAVKWYAKKDSWSRAFNR